MLSAPTIIEHFADADRTREEMLKLADELIMAEKVAVEYYRDLLKDRQLRLNEQLLNAETDTNVKVGYCEQRIQLFNGIKERLNGKDVELVVPANPLFPVEEPRRLLSFGKRKK
jgi:peroxiredoxin family protein